MAAVGGCRHPELITKTSSTNPEDEHDKPTGGSQVKPLLDQCSHSASFTRSPLSSSESLIHHSNHSGVLLVRGRINPHGSFKGGKGANTKRMAIPPQSYNKEMERGKVLQTA